MSAYSRRGVGLRGLGFLQADDVGLRFAELVKQVRQATVDVVDVETGDLHRFGRAAGGMGSHVRRRTSTASLIYSFGCGLAAVSCFLAPRNF